MATDLKSEYTESTGGDPPPPSYEINPDTTQAEDSNAPGPSQPFTREGSPLSSRKLQSHRLQRPGFAVMLTLACVLIPTMIALISFRTSTNKLRSSWALEIKEHDERLAQMEVERVQWDLERETWAEEQRERNMHQPFWGVPRRVSDRCLMYGTREYTAKLYNMLTTEEWADKCGRTPIEIKGRTHAKPVRCENHGTDKGVHGYWIVNYEPECEPTWGKFWRHGCDHLHGHRRWESALENIPPSGSNMREICQDTPVTLPTGQQFVTSNCWEDWRGWFGKWDVPDPTCNNYGSTRT